MFKKKIPQKAITNPKSCSSKPEKNSAGVKATI